MSVPPGHLASVQLDAGAPDSRPSRSAAERSRGRRVSMLLVAILCMSVGDLYMTLAHVTQAGMLEANPIARTIMSYNSPALLAAWKLSSVGLAVAIFFWARRFWRTELATWFCFLVLIWLTCRWVVYNDQVEMFAACPTGAATSPQTGWVAMTPDD